MCCNAHGDEHDEQIDPHGKVGEPAEFLERSDLAYKEACESPDQAANGVAQLELRGFRKSFTIGDDDDGHIAEQLDGLKDVEQVARPLAVEAVCKITVGSAWILVRIEA